MGCCPCTQPPTCSSQRARDGNASFTAQNRASIPKIGGEVREQQWSFASHFPTPARLYPEIFCKPCKPLALVLGPQKKRWYGSLCCLREIKRWHSEKDKETDGITYCLLKGSSRQSRNINKVNWGSKAHNLSDSYSRSPFVPGAVGGDRVFLK